MTVSSAPAAADDGAAAPLSVVIIGGGTAGWMTATALARLIGPGCRVHLIESEEIGIVGVGEATLPHIRGFNARLGIDEAEFMRATSATFKLGIQFLDWARVGDSYLHPFARFGRDANGLGFHHLWARAVHEGLDPGPLDAFCLPTMMAARNRFAHPSDHSDRIEAGYGYAYQFDATRFAPFLRGIAESAGVERSEGRVMDIVRDAGTGDIVQVALDDGRAIAGDLFVDCSGFRALLIEGAMGEPFEDWSAWLPCDRAMALPCSSAGPLAPYTIAQAQSAGWRWRIPLQHRTGNGYVFASAFLGEQAAADALLRQIDGTPLAEPRLLRFKAGRRRHAWVGNCVAIGLSGGFLEPLESTSIYLIQAAITAMLEYFPDHGRSPVNRDAFNHTLDLEYAQIRDFLILHYHATVRADSPFWDHVRTMSVPDSLAERLALFRARGRIEQHAQGLFLEPSWLAVLIGQGIMPQGVDARAGAGGTSELAHGLSRLRATIAESADSMPDHARYVAARCGIAA
ncbi:MAG: tryptophan halogenase family protein [Sphingomonas sp.]|jgi:tryptophan halogenase